MSDIEQGVVEKRLRDEDLVAVQIGRGGFEEAKFFERPIRRGIPYPLQEK